MMRFGMRATALAALALGMALVGPSARADQDIIVQLTVSVAGGGSATETYDFTTSAITAGPTFTGGASGSFTAMVLGGQDILQLNNGSFDGGNVLVDVNSTTTNAPGGTTSFLKIGTDNIENNDVSGQTITVAGVAQGYTMPTPAASFTDSTSGGVVGTATNITFNATAGGNNAAAISAGPFTNGSLAQNPAPTAATNLTAPFTMTATLGLTLAAGASTANAGGLALLNAPEPSTMAAAMTGLGLVGLTSLRRKLRKRA